jgi:methionine-rich copper-binding protein CopC
MRRKTIFLATGLLLMAGTAGLTAAEVFHFALSRSAPAADATVAAPTEVRLWFTEAPENNTVGIRLIRDGAAVQTTEVTKDPENAAVFFVKPSAPLAPGRYTVSWRGVGDDGHAVTGDFGFSVRAQ